jgi:phage baseplate assembly protein W
MADFPHLALPFSYVNGIPQVVEQGTIEDIANCVEVALRTHVGERKELPDFGTADLTFQQQPVSLSALLTQIELHEPRVIALLEQAPDALDSLILKIKAKVSTREVS